jgi:hypothetical protein
MQRVRPPALALLLLSASACAAHDKVLEPDETDGDGGARDAMVGETGRDGAAPDSGGMTDASDTGNGSDASALLPDAGSAMAKDPDCDLNGLWIGRQNTRSQALGLPQFANNWYYLELAQDGEQVVVTSHMDCGIEVQGSVLVQIGVNTIRALMERNSQVGRKGSFRKESDGSCSFEMEKFWSVRGVSEELYAPKPRSRDVSIAALQAENPLPGKAMVSTTEDWDGDQQPGITWRVTLVGNDDSRYSAQRDWTRWFSAPGYTVRAAIDFTSDLLVRAEFSNEEVVYPPTPFTLDQTSIPDAAAEHTLTLRFLGRTSSDARAQAVRTADDLETCAAIRGLLPPINRLK